MDLCWERCSCWCGANGHSLIVLLELEGASLSWAGLTRQGLRDLYLSTEYPCSRGVYRAGKVNRLILTGVSLLALGLPNR